MTFASSGHKTNGAPTVSTDAHKTLKTAFDCDVLTLARDAKLHASQALHNTAETVDPLDALYRPLGNKDVQGALCTRPAR